ncbi:MAG: hypothetical protein JW997_01610 [Actinobacteria bacterium]|nr:hypothetical protein [Actinomycetota bacterium]
MSVKVSSDDFTEQKILSKIAQLYYVDDLNQQKIAAKLNISRTKVSRSINKAKQSNIVSIKINSPLEKFIELESALEKVFELKECLVVPSNEDPAQVYGNMAVLLAELLDRLLDDGDMLGIGWGATLKNISASLVPLKKMNIKMVPLLGGLGKVGIEIHTNSVSSMLGQKYGGLSYAIHSPAVLDSRQAKEIMEKDSGVSEIFKLCEKIETALIGMSDLGEDSTLIKTGNFSIDDFKYLEGLGAAGDVNLIFINEEGKEIKNKLDERLLRMSPERLKKVKNVIGAAFGPQKIRVMLGALRGEFINILLTDENTAIELIKNA